jgi:hypothetical protein
LWAIPASWAGLWYHLVFGAKLLGAWLGIWQLDLCMDGEEAMVAESQDYWHLVPQL